MKRILVLLLSLCILFSCSGCKLKQVVRSVKSIVDQAKSIKRSTTIEDVIKPPEGSPDWCGYKNADKWIKKHLFRDTSTNYSIDTLLGIKEFRGGSYGAADINVSYIGGEGHESHYGTIYFNEDGSDIWIHVEMYEGIGTDVHIVDGKIVEEIEFKED